MASSGVDDDWSAAVLIAWNVTIGPLIVTPSVHHWIVEATLLVRRVPTRHLVWLDNLVWIVVLGWLGPVPVAITGGVAHGRLIHE